MPTSAPIYNLVIQSGYQSVFIGLYNHKDQIAVRALDKKMVSSSLVSSLLEILKEHLIPLDHIAYIGIDAGPAPFTTLRVSISTANGLSFAKKIPLIATSGLEELSRYYPDYTVILNAFCNDVYVGKNGILSCQNITTFLEHEYTSLKNPMTYIGNAVSLHQPLIQELLKEKGLFLHDYPYEATLDMIAHAAYEKWCHNKDRVYQVYPLYLKEYSTQQTPMKGA